MAVTPSRKNKKRLSSRRHDRLRFESLEARRLLAVIATDDFESYTAGEQVESNAGVGLNGGTGWTGAYNVADANRAGFTIIDSGLSYSTPQFTISGGTRAMQITELPNGPTIPLTRPFPTQSGSGPAAGSLYLSFLYNNTVDAGTTTESGDDFLQIGFNSSSTTDPRPSITDRNTTFQLRRTANSADSNDTGVVSQTGQTYLLVMRLDKTGTSATYNSVRFYINPQSLTEPTVADSTSTTDSGLNLTSQAHFVLRQAFQELGDTYVIDNLRIATTYEEAINGTIIINPGEVIWDGDAGDGDWNNPVNWVGDTNIPDAADETAIFRDTGAGTIVNPTVINVPASPDPAYTIKGIRFENGAGTAYTLNGGALLLETLSNVNTGSNTVNTRLAAGATTTVIAEAGTLKLNNTANDFDTVDEIRVEPNGTLQVAVTTANVSAIASADVILNGGTLQFAQVPVPVSNSFAHFGFHASSDANQNLNNNGGLLSGGFGATNAPGFNNALVRTGAINFANDAAFTATGAVSITDNFSNLFIAKLTVTPAMFGTWSFRTSANDDRGGLWVDIDRDGVFELSNTGFSFTSNNTGGGSNGELIIYENGTARSVTLGDPAGIETREYWVAITHREGTGGSNLAMHVDPPGAVAEELINPSSANQAGWWSIDTVSGTMSIANRIDVLGDAVISSTTPTAFRDVPLTLTGPVTIGSASVVGNLQGAVGGAGLTIENLILANNGGVGALAAGSVTTINSITDNGNAFQLTTSGLGDTVLADSTPGFASAIVAEGTLRLGVDNGVPVGTTLLIGTTGAATFDVAGFTQTLASVTQGANASTVLVPRGTLTVNGDFTAGLANVGVADNTLAASGQLIVNGGAVNIGNGTGNMFIGSRANPNTQSTNTPTQAVVDFRNATSVNINVANLRLGIHTAGDNGNNTGEQTRGTLLLSLNGENTITATAAAGETTTGGAAPGIAVGDSASPGGTADLGDEADNGNLIVLGNGINNINTNTLTLGGRKSFGSMRFDSTGGTLNLRGATGGTSLADVYVSNMQVDTGVDGTASLDLSGGTFNAQIDLLALGRHFDGGGSGDGTLTFDAGDVSVATAVFGHANTENELNGSTAAQNTQGTLLMRGGTLSITDSLTAGLNGGQGELRAEGGIVNIGSSTARADVFLADATVAHNIGSTAIVDLSGATVNAFLDEFVVGRKFGAGTGTTNASFTMNAGTIDANSLTIAVRTVDGNAGSVNGTMNINGGSLIVSGTATIGEGNTGITSTTNTNAVVNVATGGTFGAGTLRLAENANVNGTVNLNGGTVQFATLSQGAGIPAFNFDSGTIQNLPSQNLTNTNVTINLLTAGTHEINVDAGQTATIQDTAALANVGSLTKTGAGTLILSGANTYGGGTTVSAGALRASNTTGSATGSGDVTVGSTGLLEGEGTIGGNVVVQSGGTINAGNGADDLGNLTVNGNLTFEAGSSLDVDIDGTTSDVITVLGAVSIDNTAVITGDVLNPSTHGLDYIVIDDQTAGSVNGAFNTSPLGNGGFFLLDSLGAQAYYDRGATNNDVAIVFNERPIAVNDNISIPEGSSLTGGNVLVANGLGGAADSDPDGDALQPNVQLVAGSLTGGSLTLNANGTFDFTPPVGAPGPFSFQYTITDSLGLTSLPATVTITIQPVANAPTLGVASASGNEDTAITLPITITPTDASEPITLVISGVPDGSSLSAGTLVSSSGGFSTYEIEFPANHDFSTFSLTITPPANSDVDFTLGVEAISTETNDTTASSGVQNLAVTVNAVADTPTLNPIASPISTLEDVAVSLGISGSLSDTDGSETLTYTISGAPSGATFVSGALNTPAGSLNSGVWTFTATEVADGLKLVPPTNSDADITLQVTAVATDTGGVTAPSATQTLVINVTAVADAPATFTVPAAINGGENQPILLGLSGTLFDTDGSETLFVEITDVPATATIIGGTQTGPTTWLVPQANFGTAAITQPDNTPGNASFRLSFRAYSQETDPSATPPTADFPTTPTSEVTIVNLEPEPVDARVEINGAEVDLLANPTVTVVPGLAVTFIVSTLDPAFDHLDAPFRFEIDFGDGLGTATAEASEEGEEVRFTYTYGKLSGDTPFQPTLTVFDKNDPGAQLSVTVDLPPVVSDVQMVIDGVLYVGGGSGGDRIVIAPGGLGGFRVRYNNRLLEAVSVDSKIVVYGNGGNDTIMMSGSYAPVEFYGGAGDDYLTGGGLDDILDGGEGRDRMMGNGGDDIILGGGGNDTASGGLGNDYLSGDEYIDFRQNLFRSLDEPPVLSMSTNPGNDNLNGDRGDDVVVGGAGNDTLTGGDGLDLISGDAGNDKINGGNDSDLLLGGIGADILFGLSGNDVLIGGGGADTVYGGNGVDLMYGSDINLNTFDAADLAALWMMWQNDDFVGGLDFLASGAKKDNANDLLAGQGDEDYFLLFAGDNYQSRVEKATEPFRLLP